MNPVYGPHNQYANQHYLPQQITNYIPHQIMEYMPVIPYFMTPQPLTVEDYRKHYHNTDSFTYANTYKTITNPSQAIVTGFASAASKAANLILSFKGKN
ncbi:MAG: hypothetical protein AB7V50_10995 [Vampirovibrionia bacterium]